MYTNFRAQTFLRSAPTLIPSTGDLNLTFTANKHNCGIRFLEQVQVKMDLIFPGRGHLEMTSKSPGGTKSQLLYSRLFDTFSNKNNLTNWNVTSLHYWGENPAGDWNITIRSTQQRKTGRKGNTRLTFHQECKWKAGVRRKGCWYKQSEDTNNTFFNLREIDDFPL